MNYIALINAFWDSATTNPLSTGQVSLYFALLHVCNRSNWTEWFQAPNQVLSVLTGMSRSGILKARNELKQRGLIDFRERGTKATIYCITMVNSTQVGVQNGVQNSTRNGVQDGVQNSNTLYKHKQKQNLEKKDTNVSKEKPGFAPPSVEEVAAYCQERGNGIDARAFVDFYAARGWMMGKTPMSDWKAGIRYWEGRRKDEGESASVGNTCRRSSAPNRFHNFDQPSTSYDAIMQEQLRRRMMDEETDG